MEKIIESYEDFKKKRTNEILGYHGRVIFYLEYFRNLTPSEMEVIREGNQIIIKNINKLI